jgi:hypothetical protein
MFILKEKRKENFLKKDLKTLEIKEVVLAPFERDTQTL